VTAPDTRRGGPGQGRPVRKSTATATASAVEDSDLGPLELRAWRQALDHLAAIGTPGLAPPAVSAALARIPAQRRPYLTVLPGGLS